MKKKSIFVLILIISISLVGCGNNSSNSNTANDSTNKVVEDTKKAKDDVKDATEGVKDNLEAAGDSLKYTAQNLKDDIVNAGYKLEDSVNTKKDYFKGSETDYLMANDVVRVYEYNSATDLEQDIKRIAPNGLTINGTDANYTKKPYYYRKGNSLIVYEGNEPAYIDEFKTMYGNPLVWLKTRLLVLNFKLVAFCYNQIDIFLIK